MKSYWSCDLDPDSYAPDVSVIVLPYMWGYLDKGGDSEPVDIKVRIDKRVTYKEVVELLETASMSHLKNLGGGKLRGYYIEDFEINSEGELYVVWGT